MFHDDLLSLDLIKATFISDPQELLFFLHKPAQFVQFVHKSVHPSSLHKRIAGTNKLSFHQHLPLCKEVREFVFAYFARSKTPVLKLQ